MTEQEELQMFVFEKNFQKLLEQVHGPLNKNKMTYNNDIEKTEAEIKVLQAKLELLKEIETYKSQPRMVYVKEGKVKIVSYNDNVYYRLDLPDGSHNWYKRKYTDEGELMMVAITDRETHRLLEGLWFNDVKGVKK